MINQHEKRKSDIVNELNSKSFSGKVVSIGEAATITKSPYKKQQFPYQKYHLHRHHYLPENDCIELAEFSNVISNHIFQLFFPEHNLAIIQDASYKNALNGFFSMPHEYQDGVISFKWNKPLVYIDDPVLMIGGHNNHFHWILNWLPRLFVAKAFQDMFGSLDKVKVCVHQGISKNYIESLEKLGIKQEQLIFTNINYRTTENFYFFRKLYVPTFFQTDSFSHFIRDSYLSFSAQGSLLKNDTSLPKLVYISRQKEKRKRRRVVNNDELEKCLKRYGFETIFGEDLSFEEQMNLFYNADLVLGPHGAGLANIVFCRPQTKVLVFEYSHGSMFDGLAKSCQLDPTIMITEQHIDEAYEKENPQFESRLRDFIVDIEQVEAYLKDNL